MSRWHTARFVCQTFRQFRTFAGYSQDLNRVDKRLAAAGFEDTVYDQAIAAEEASNVGPVGSSSGQVLAIAPRSTAESKSNHDHRRSEKKGRSIKAGRSIKTGRPSKTDRSIKTGRSMKTGGSIKTHRSIKTSRSNNPGPSAIVPIALANNTSPSVIAPIALVVAVIVPIAPILFSIARFGRGSQQGER